MSKLSEQQEAFCRHLIEGKTQYEAYIAAGYSDTNSSHANASRLISKDKIANRLAELRGNAAESAEVTLEWLLEKAKQVLEAAMKDNSHAASIGAIKELGILSGQRVEKSQRENINRNVDEYTEQELVDYIASGGGAGITQSKDRTPQPDRLH